MKIDNEKLTAFALGELEGEEKASVEKYIAENETAQKYVNDILETAGLITDELKSEPEFGLLDEQKEKIHDASKVKPGNSNINKSRRPVLRVLMPAAAVIALLFAAGLYLPKVFQKGDPDNKSYKETRDLAMYEVDRMGVGVREERSGKKIANKEISKSERDKMQKYGIRGAPETKKDSNGGIVATSDSLNRLRTLGYIKGPVSENEKTVASNPSRMKKTPAQVFRLNKEVADEEIEEVLEICFVTSESDGEDAKPYFRTNWGYDKRSLPDTVTPDTVLNDPTNFNTEQYDRIVENVFLKTKLNPLSTFSIDVDTASYANVRRFINQGSIPPAGAVRLEELINYFTYDYPQPEGDDPFSANVEIAGCPWNYEHRLAKIGLKGKDVVTETRPPMNIVFLLDVSGSMNSMNKLGLVKQAMKLLVNNLDERDYISIAVYAGASGLVLPSTSCEQKNVVINALERLKAGGSTNGGAGIELAYKTATANFIEGGINRVILCTDGDFNVGVTDDGSLVKMIEKKAKSGVFLSVLGFGMGNYKDSKMEQLADKGNGNYAYIDTEEEAKKVLCDQMTGTLITIAKDVKIQIEFNPNKVSAYRLVGYENRMLNKEDFNDDTKDAGEIGAGHTVTVLYEIVPFGKQINTPGVDPLRYEKTSEKKKETGKAASNETLFLKLRYKAPDGDTSKLIEVPVNDTGKGYAEASEDFKFAASVASFGMILRNSKFKGSTSIDAVYELAEEGLGPDEAGYRKAFIELVKKTKRILIQK